MYEAKKTGDDLELTALQVVCYHGSTPLQKKKASKSDSEVFMIISSHEISYSN